MRERWPQLRDLEGSPLIYTGFVQEGMGGGVGCRKEGQKNQCTHV